MEIVIFDANEKHFGQLSNNYNYPLELDNRKWNTPRNYIYGNMFWEHSRKTLLGNSSVKDVQMCYVKEVELQRQSIIRQALNNAFPVIFNNIKSKQALLNTGDKKLVLKDNGEMLGSGTDGNGANIYGLQLEQYREHLFLLERKKIIQQKNEALEDKRYTIYCVYKSLKRHMQDGYDIIEYIHMGYKDILYKFDTSKLLKKSNFIRLYNEDSLTLPIYVKEQFVNDNDLFVAIIRANEIGNLQLKRKWQRKDIIFRFYLRDLIAQNYENLSEEDQNIAINQSLNGNEYINFKNKIVDLYERGMLNNNVSGDIEIFLDDRPEITQQDIMEAKEILSNPYITDSKSSSKSSDKAPSISSKSSSKSSDKAPSISSKSSSKSSDKAPSISSAGSDVNVHNPFNQQELSSETRDDNSINTNTEDKKVYTEQLLYSHKKDRMSTKFKPYNSNSDQVNIYTINPNDILSPSIYSRMLSIKAKNYPTTAHYVCACLLEKLYNSETDNEQIGPSIAHDLIMTYPDQSQTDRRNYVELKSLPMIFKKYYTIAFESRLKRNTTRALNKKFSHRFFQDVLLRSLDHKLIYADVKNKVLGIGPNRNGQNFVGNHLMNIRQKLRTERKQIPEHISVTNIEAVINKDEFLKKWVTDRTNDMIQSITYMNLYLCEKQGKCGTVTGKYVNEILSYIYQPCSHLTKMSQTVKTPVPVFYTDMARSYMKELDTGSIKVLWNYIATMLYFIIKHSSNTADIQKMISDAQRMTSSNKLFNSTVNEPFEKYILIAIIKILIRIRQYNSETNTKTTFNNQDIILAIRLILGQLVELKDIEEIDDTNSINIMKEMEAYDIKEGDFDSGLNNTILFINGAVDYISKHKSPYEVKLNRVNFYRN